MRKLELDIQANDRDWLYTQYVTKQRGMKDISLECKTTEDSIRNRLKRFGIHVRDHKQALSIRNINYPNKVRPENREEVTNKLRTGKYIECAFCLKSIYVNKKSTRKFCSRRCNNLYRMEHRARRPNWRDWVEYGQWRNLVYSRDCWKCRICGSKVDINAHHIVYAKHREDLRFDTSNGITLCKKHHIQVHSPTSKELLLNNPNIGESPEVDNPEASIREYLYSLIRSND